MNCFLCNLIYFLPLSPPSSLLPLLQYGLLSGGSYELYPLPPAGGLRLGCPSCDRCCAGFSTCHLCVVPPDHQRPPASSGKPLKGALGGGLVLQYQCGVVSDASSYLVRVTQQIWCLRALAYPTFSFPLLNPLA